MVSLTSPSPNCIPSYKISQGQKEGGEGEKERGEGAGREREPGHQGTAQARCLWDDIIRKSPSGGPPHITQQPSQVLERRAELRCPVGEVLGEVSGWSMRDYFLPKG